MKRSDGKEKLSKYSGTDRTLLPYFTRCHGRVNIGKCSSIQWPRNKDGYLKFCKEIGPIPKNMNKPSVGRKNHRKGYVKGNIRWEEHKFNSVKRRGTKFQHSKTAVVELNKGPAFHRGSPEWLESSRRGSIKRWSDPKQKVAARKRMIGNKFAEGNELSNEHKKAISKRHKGNKYNLGKKLSKKTKLAMKIAQQKRRAREATKKRKSK